MKQKLGKFVLLAAMVSMMGAASAMAEGPSSDASSAVKKTGPSDCGCSGVNGGLGAKGDNHVAIGADGKPVIKSGGAQ